VTIPASLTFYMELGLEILLALTLCYCVILERRLAAVRKGQEGLSRTIGELNMAISGAGASLRALKSAAGEAAQTLDDLPTPALILDRAVLRRNLKRMSERLRNAGVMLRPHLKTAKSIEVGRMAVEGHDGRITVSTLAEARYFANGGFDTHANERGRHDRLMQGLADSVGAFWADLKAQKNDERVLMMTFSEFGRRVAQNASGGTDHGTAAPMFLMGPAVKGGIVGEHPSLTDLDHGDLKYRTDFRSVYATVLQSWLDTPSKTILGQQFKLAPVLRV